MASRRDHTRDPVTAAGKIEREPPARKFRWPPRLAALLGKIPDDDLARRAKVSKTTVLKERRRRGMPASRYQRPVIQWTSAMIALLGEDTDPAVAAELGIGAHSVSRKRRILGIPAHIPPRGDARGYRWTARAIALLGTAADPTIARRLHISTNQVEFQRNLRGIPPFQPGPRAVVWSQERIELLGNLADREVATRLGICEQTVGAKRRELGIPARFAKGGTIKRTATLRRVLRLPTREVVQHGIMSQHMVWKLRKEYGIPPPGGFRRPARWTPALLARLGKEPDESIAAELGAHPATVSRKRKSLGIALPRTWRGWTERERALLGTMPDADLARLIGRSEAAVQTQRSLVGRQRAAKAGIALVFHRRWSERELALLGTMPDADLARLIGRTELAVRKRRALEGHPPKRRRAALRRAAARRNSTR